MSPQPRLSLLSPSELSDDLRPDQPFRLELDGWWQVSADGKYTSANISVRLDSEDLAALLAQARAAQLALVTRIRRTGEAPDALAAERAHATRVALRHPDPPPNTALLELVLVKLRQLT